MIMKKDFGAFVGKRVAGQMVPGATITYNGGKTFHRRTTRGLNPAN
jgi:hypothetical protein